MMNFILILSCPVDIGEREHYLRDVIKQNLTLVCIGTFADQFLSNLVR